MTPYLKCIMVTNAVNLKSFFHSGVNRADYSGLIDNAKSAMVGNLPKTIRSVAAREYPQDARGEMLNDIVQAYKKAADALKNIEKLQIQAFRRVPANDCEIRRFPNIIDDFDLDLNMVHAEDSLYHEKKSNYLLMAEDELTKVFANLLPNLKNIIIKPLKDGNFSKTYKVDFIQSDSTDSMSSQVLKVYRDNPLRELVMNLIIRFIKNADDNTIANLAHCSIADAALERCTNLSDALLGRNLVEIQKYSKRGHGARAEANMAEYIRYMSRHKIRPEEGIVVPDMFVLGETEFSISRFIPSWFKTDKEFDFGCLGLVHTDYIRNPDNNVGGVCVDIGGIMPAITARYNKPSNIVGDKLGTYIMKHFSQFQTKIEQLKFLQDLYRESAKFNYVDRDKTRKVIDEIVQIHTNIDD